MDKFIRSTFRLGVAYGSSVDTAPELRHQALRRQPEALDNMPQLVVFEDFGDSALIFDLFFWCQAGGKRELRQIRSDIRFRIVRWFEEAGIVISFPQRDVHLDTARPLEVKLQPHGSGDE